MLSSRHRHDRPPRPGLRLLGRVVVWIAAVAGASGFGWVVAHPQVSAVGAVQAVSGVYTDEETGGPADQLLARQPVVTVEFDVHNDGRFPVAVSVPHGGRAQVTWSRVSPAGSRTDARLIGRAMLDPQERATIRVTVDSGVCSRGPAVLLEELTLRVATASVPVAVQVPLPQPIMFRPELFDPTCDSGR